MEATYFGKYSVQGNVSWSSDCEWSPMLHYGKDGADVVVMTFNDRNGFVALHGYDYGKLISSAENICVVSKGFWLHRGTTHMRR